jgi:hypothetical protein
MLAGGSSLARKRGVRNPSCLPPLTEEQILAWAQSYRRANGVWPRYRSGPVAEAPGESWARIDSALRYGRRGLGGGSSLAKLLARGEKDGR